MPNEFKKDKWKSRESGVPYETSFDGNNYYYNQHSKNNSANTSVMDYNQNILDVSDPAKSEFLLRNDAVKKNSI